MGTRKPVTCPYADGKECDQYIPRKKVSTGSVMSAKCLNVNRSIEFIKVAWQGCPKTNQRMN